MENSMITSGTQRRVDLDWVRIIAFSLLIWYHVGMYYVTWDWHIKSPNASSAIEPLMFMTSPWRLALLFLVSGAATGFLLAKSSLAEFVRGRSSRLLLPLVFAMLVIVPPQSYYEVVEKIQYAGSYLQFWARYLSFDQSFCKGKDCLILPTYNHLWFVAYLWAYTMLLALVCWRAPNWLEKARTNGGQALSGWRVIVVPWLYLALARLVLLPIFPPSHALVNDWYNHAIYLPIFAVGFVFVKSPKFWEDIVRYRWLTLALAVLSYAGIQIYFAAYAVDAVPPSSLRTLMRTMYALNQWSAILAVLGWAKRWSPADGPIRRYLTEAIFPLYILHQTVIILLAVNLRQFDLPAPLEGAILLAATVIICFALYEGIRRAGPLRPFFGLKRHQRAGELAVVPL
jgi:glucan biosynthesis protein C